MSHNLTIYDNMISGRLQTPWHGIGEVTQDVTIADLERIIGWTVNKEKLFLPDGTFTNSYATTRTVKDIKTGTYGETHGPETKIILGVGLSNGYKVLQNLEMIEAIKPLIEMGCTLETCGSLEEGKRVWVLLRLQSDLVIGNNDPIAKYILVSNDHAGRQAAKFGVVGVRVVCNNTLSAAEESKESRLLSIYHKGDVKGNLDQAVRILDSVNGQFLAYGQQLETMTKKGFDQYQLRDFVKTVFFGKKTLIESDQERLERIQRQIENAFLTGPGSDLATAKGTVYGAYQAVNHYLNHETKGSLERRLGSLTFGSARQTDAKAFALALKV